MLGCRVRMDPASAFSMMGQVIDSMAGPSRCEAVDEEKDKSKEKKENARPKAKAKAAVVKQVCAL